VEIARLRELEKTYTEVIENLHQDIDRLEKENDKLKKAHKSAAAPSSSRQTSGLIPGLAELLGAPSAGEAPVVSTDTKQRPAFENLEASKIMNEKLEALRATVRHLRKENIGLKVRTVQHSLLSSLQPEKPTQRVQPEKHSVISTEARALLRVRVVLMVAFAFLLLNDFSFVFSPVPPVLLPLAPPFSLGSCNNVGDPARGAIKTASEGVDFEAGGLGEPPNIFARFRVPCPNAQERGIKNPN
jgi:hypothetical protein